MAETRSLKGTDRDFLTLVSRAAFSNPFSVERDQLDATLAETRGDDPAVLSRLLARLEQRLEAIDAVHTRRMYGRSDADLLDHGILFAVFHRHVDAIDAMIREQVAAGSRPVRAPFAGSILGDLDRHGIDAGRALRMLTLFYQMRRAYYFIARELVGRGESMRLLRQSLWNNVFTHDIRLYERVLWNRLEDFSTILLGETGTGKGAAAAAIGRSGYIPYDESCECFAESFMDVFVSINLSQFPESLIESELFGHRRGAFTGALEAHEGIFAQCRPHGAILLDEIGEVSIPVQIKLLRVLEERVFTPVGSRETRRFSGRVIAATHRSLDELRREGRFRDDFYYRLCSDVIVVPPLRQRLAEAPTELEELVAHLVGRLLEGGTESLVEGLCARIRRGVGEHHPWPGNVRELGQMVRRVLLSGECSASLPQVEVDGDPWAPLLRDGTPRVEDLVAAYCRHLYARHGTFVDVARATGLDRRTVRRYVGVD